MRTTADKEKEGRRTIRAHHIDKEGGELGHNGIQLPPHLLLHNAIVNSRPSKPETYSLIHC